MNKFILPFFFTASICTASLGCSTAADRPSQERAEVLIEEQNQLFVDISPKTMQVQIGEFFEAIVQVKNESAKPKAFILMSSSWQDNWKVDNPCMSLTGGLMMYTHNDPVTIKLAPGEFYEKQVLLAVKDPPPHEVISFRIDFTPIGSKKAYWSNKVELRVKPKEPRKEKKRNKKEGETGRVEEWREENRRKTGGKPGEENRDIPRLFGTEFVASLAHW